MLDLEDVEFRKYAEPRKKVLDDLITGNLMSQERRADLRGWERRGRTG